MAKSSIDLLETLHVNAQSKATFNGLVRGEIVELVRTNYDEIALARTDFSWKEIAEALKTSPFFSGRQVEISVDQLKLVFSRIHRSRCEEIQQTTHQPRRQPVNPSGSEE